MIRRSTSHFAMRLTCVTVGVLLALLAPAATEAQIDLEALQDEVAVPVGLVAESRLLAWLVDP